MPAFRSTLLDRLRQYPSYVEKITGVSYDDFVKLHTGDSDHTDELLERFVRMIMAP